MFRRDRTSLCKAGVTNCFTGRISKDSASEFFRYCYYKVHMFRFRERTSLCEGDHMMEIKCKHWTDISCYYIPPGETGMNWHCHSSVENIWSVADQGIESISSRGTAPVCKGYFDSLNHRLASHRLLILHCVSDQYSQWYYLSISRDTSSNHHGVDNWCNVPCTNASANEGAFDVEATPISAATILPWVPLTAISAFLLKRKVCIPCNEHILMEITSQFVHIGKRLVYWHWRAICSSCVHGRPSTYPVSHRNWQWDFINELKLTVKLDAGCRTQHLWSNWKLAVCFALVIWAEG